MELSKAGGKSQTCHPPPPPPALAATIPSTPAAGRIGGRASSARSAPNPVHRVVRQASARSVGLMVKIRSRRSARIRDGKRYGNVPVNPSSAADDISTCYD